MSQITIFRMPYLNATITEISRLSNIGPTTIPHRATTDTEFMGFDIKKNYILLANLNSIHMDKDHWGDPETFRPERFLDDNGRFVNNDPWMIPFGSGDDEYTIIKAKKGFSPSRI